MAYNDRALRGIGGWLAFFILTLAVFGPLSNAAAIWGLYAAPAPPGMADRWPLFRAVSAGEAVLSSAIVLFVAWRLYARHNPASVRIAVVGLWVPTLVIAPVSLLLVSAVLRVPLSTVLASGGLALIRPVVYSVIWTLYLLNSRRVANTYTAEPDELEAVFE